MDKITTMNIGIIGVGKLGLCYALTFEQKGFNVIASSYKKDYIDQLCARQIDTAEPGVAELVANTNIEFTVDNHHVINQCDVIYVMVATPSNPAGDYDITAVEQVVNDLMSHSSDIKDKILIIGSTVNPGDCVQFQEKLFSRGVHVVYCPTFVSQGIVLKEIVDPHSLLLGTENKTVSETCRQIFVKIVGENTPVFCVHPTTAEILKLGGNCRSTLDISYFNVMGQIIINSGLIDDLSASSEYLNFVKIKNQWRPGYGYGGPCYPRDNRSLVHYANKVGINYTLGQVVDEFNTAHSDFLFKHFIQDNTNQLPYYFEYLSYKPGVNIFEESQQLVVCKKLLDAGYTVYVEPSVYLLPKIKNDLGSQYTNVHFVSIEDLTNQGIKVYSSNNLIKE